MRDDLSPAKREQLPFFYVYGFLFAAFGFFGMYYLWDLAQS